MKMMHDQSSRSGKSCVLAIMAYKKTADGQVRAMQAHAGSRR
jgi:hypothetical protein